jgi:hypothetical protein
MGLCKCIWQIFTLAWCKCPKKKHKTQQYYEFKCKKFGHVEFTDHIYGYWQLHTQHWYIHGIGSQWTSTHHTPSTGCLLLLSCGWTSTELIFGYSLVTNSVGNKSPI